MVRGRGRLAEILDGRRKGGSTAGGSLVAIVVVEVGCRANQIWVHK